MEKSYKVTWSSSVEVAIPRDWKLITTGAQYERHPERFEFTPVMHFYTAIVPVEE